MYMLGQFIQRITVLKNNELLYKHRVQQTEQTTARLTDRDERTKGRRDISQIDGQPEKQKRQYITLTELLQFSRQRRKRLEWIVRKPKINTIVSNEERMGWKKV